MIRMALSIESVERAVRIGNARCRAKPDGIREHDSGYHADLDRALPHRYGAAGEIAIEKITGWPIDEAIYPHGDDYDCNGVEVKVSTFTGSDIHLKVKVSEYARKRPRAYILVRVRKDIFERHPDPVEDGLRRCVDVLGFITQEAFEQVKRLHNYGYLQNNWVVPKYELVRCRVGHCPGAGARSR